MDIKFYKSAQRHFQILLIRQMHITEVHFADVPWAAIYVKF